MNETFTAYAEYYDLVYSDKDYGTEAAYIDSLIKKNLAEAKTILEFGCGTGIHSEHLARMGYTVHGIDLSAQMIAKAKMRRDSLPEEIANRLCFSTGDARTLKLSSEFDVVISLFHVFSYQTTDGDVEAVINNAQSHLKSVGLFIFDYWNGAAVLTEKPEVRVKRLENEKIRVTRIAEPTILENANTVDVNYTIFIEDLLSNSISQVNETHSMRYFFSPEIRRLFLSDEWIQPCSYNWLTESPLSKSGWAGVTTVLKQNTR